MNFKQSRNYLLVTCLVFLGCASPVQQAFVEQAAGNSVDQGDYNQVRMLYNNGGFEQAAEGASYLIQNSGTRTVIGAYQLAQNLEVRIKSKAMTDAPGAINDLLLLLSEDYFRNPEDESYLGLLYIFEGEISKGREIIDRINIGALFDGAPATNVIPRSSTAPSRLAVAYLLLSDLENAKAYFEKAVVNAHELKSGRQCFFDFGICDEVNRGRMITARYFEALSDAFNIWLEEGDLEEARNILLSLNPIDFEVMDPVDLEPSRGSNVYDHFIVGQLIDQINTQETQFEAAIAQATGSLSEPGAMQAALESLGALYLSRSDQKVIESIALVSASYQNNEPTEDARMHLARANIYLGEQNYPLAIESYRQMISVSPWVFGAFFNLALIYGTDEQYEQAIKTMQHFLLLDPNSAQSRQARDQIYEWELRAEL